MSDFKTKNDLFIKDEHLKKLQYFGIDHRLYDKNGLIFQINNLLNDNGLEEEDYEILDQISLELAEDHYYNETFK
ncbi:MAG: hypothetical protein R3Y21_03520 [Mycoplasmatota bacterium]